MEVFDRQLEHINACPPPNSTNRSIAGLTTLSDPKKFTSNIRLISYNNEPDWHPTLMPDGRILFSRWEYTDKALWRIQSLWTVRPDGTRLETFWGNQSVWPDHPTEARPIPGTSKVIFTGTAHHDYFAGSIGIIDNRLGLNYPRGLTRVTWEAGWPVKTI